MLQFDDVHFLLKVDNMNDPTYNNDFYRSKRYRQYAELFPVSVTSSDAASSSETFQTLRQTAEGIGVHPKHIGCG